MLHRSTVTLVLATVAHCYCSIIGYHSWRSMDPIEIWKATDHDKHGDLPSQIEFNIRGNVADIPKIHKKLRFHFRRAKQDSYFKNYPIYYFFFY